ncbi:MAG: HD domain-containing protein [Candidatus Woesearchaeota archaeon]
MDAYTGTVGRRRDHGDEILINDPYLTDFCKITQSKAYRRLAHKTQVICAPDNPHVRTRLLHTDEVVALSVGIADKLGLDIPMCMAIAAGHDIGHTPYGHLGERVLSERAGKPFKHYVNSVVVAQHIERKGAGLNLTKETLEGMLNHSRGVDALTVDPSSIQEHSVVMFADKISYTFSDMNDAVRYGYLCKEKIPYEANRLGWNQRVRILNVVTALAEESRRKGFVDFSDSDEFHHFDSLKKFMYENVYFKMDDSIQNQILHRIVDFFEKSNDFSDLDPILLTSLLTDREANHFGELMLHSRKPALCDIRHFGIFEIVDFIREKEIDLTDPDLDWEPAEGTAVQEPDFGPIHSW